MENGSLSWLTIMGFVFLTFNSAKAIHNSKEDMGSIYFTLVSYLDLAVLFWFLMFYKGAPDSPSRERLKALVWFLTTLLTGMLCCQLGAVMPFGGGLFIWVVPFASSLVGFYLFFLRESERQGRPTLG